MTALTRRALQCTLRLLLTPGVGRQTARQLLQALGDAETLFAAPFETLAALVGPKKAHALGQHPDTLDTLTDTTWSWLAESPNHRVVCWGQDDFPSALQHIEDPPIVLFTQGCSELLTMPLALAIVGSRNPSPQGARDANAFASALAQSGFVIVSGLASGIDTAAHEGALSTGGATIAIVGTGLDRVFPTHNAELAGRIGQSGLLISEYVLGSPPLAAHFPQRNRIISGLTVGTLVVEAALKSGSLITARMALEQGREVFAIPGSIHSPIAKGCHQLIKQGAKLVESAHDILEELQGHWAHVQPASTPAPITPGGDAPKAAHPLLQVLGHQLMNLDELQALTGWDAAHLQIQLLDLEMQNRVARVAGGLFQQVTTG